MLHLCENTSSLHRFCFMSVSEELENGNKTQDQKNNLESIVLTDYLLTLTDFVVFQETHYILLGILLIVWQRITIDHLCNINCDNTGNNNTGWYSMTRGNSLLSSSKMSSESLSSNKPRWNPLKADHLNISRRPMIVNITDGCEYLHKNVRQIITLEHFKNNTTKIAWF